jgi:GT2 family glycosyltransferase
MASETQFGCISFVILTWNSEPYIQKCIESVFSTLAPTPFGAEVFVVDNGSGDGSAGVVWELARRWPRQVFSICLDKNLGTTRSRNLALSRCRGEYICVMDSDVEMKPGAIARLIRTLEADRARGLVAPRLVYPDGRFQKSTDGFPTPGRKLVRFFGLRAIEAREARSGRHHRIRPVDYAISAVWVFRRSLIQKVGFLDENIFYAPEDADFCLRVWQAGRQVIFDPGAEAVHHTQEAGRGFRINRTVLHHIAGLLYYFYKHRILFSRRRPVPDKQISRAGNSR